MIVNSPVQLTCEAYGIPPPEVYWIKNGERVGEEAPGITLLANGALRFFRAEVSSVVTPVSYYCPH